MPYSVKPNNTLRNLSPSSQRKLELFSFALNGKESSTTVNADLRTETQKALLNQNISSVDNIASNLRSYVTTTLAKSIRNGASLGDAIQALEAGDAHSRGPFARARHSSMLIAKTELARARQQAIINYYTSKEEFVYFTWISVRVNTTCDRCRERHNKYKKLTNWYKVGVPPLHCGCKCCLVPGYSVPDDVIYENFKEEL